MFVVLIVLACGCQGVLLENSRGRTGAPPTPPPLPGTDGGLPPPGDAATQPPPSPTALYPYASVGTRCVEGREVEHLVLSTLPPDCAVHAEALRGERPPSESVVIALDDPSPLRRTLTLCAASGACADTAVELTVSVDASGASGSWRAAIAGQPHGETFRAARCDFEAIAPTTSPLLVSDVRIREIALYQGVEALIARDGESLDPSVPIVAGRDALLRVFVEPLPGAAMREIVAHVELGEGEPLEARLVVRGASTRESLESSANVRIPGARIEPGVPLRVELRETVSGCRAEEAPPGAIFPSGGATYAVPAESNGGALRIVLVPVRYDADGSGRIPNLDAALRESFRAFAYSLFPVRDIDLVVRDAPMPWGSALASNGSGWSALLNACRNLRTSDAPPADTYYYCVFNPAPTFREFCGRGCTSGLGFVPSARDVASRTSIGLGYPGSEDTFAHEVGHTLGRPHAPCGSAGDPDPEYPHAGGRIGTWGYDLVGNQLRDPTDFGDLMGYCSPKWISDYTYSRIFSRLQAVRAAAFTFVGEPIAHATLAVDVDGSLAWGDVASLTSSPDGEPRRAVWIDGDGSRHPVTAHYSRASDLPGGAAVVPLRAGAARLEIEGLGALDVTR